MANQPQQPDTALHNASHLMQYHDLIESIVAALDARDAYTASHSDRVADMVLVLAAALGLDEDETTRIHMAAHLHDIGKIAMTSAACRREIEKNSGIMYDPRVAAAALEHWDELVSRYAGADTPRTPYFDRLQLEHTRQAHDYLLTHQGSRITLPELAAKFHLSQSSLKICFKALASSHTA